jgi:hypothetical protein
VEEASERLCETDGTTEGAVKVETYTTQVRSSQVEMERTEVFIEIIKTVLYVVLTGTVDGTVDGAAREEVTMLGRLAGRRPGVTETQAERRQAGNPKDTTLAIGSEARPSSSRCWISTIQ